ARRRDPRRPGRRGAAPLPGHRRRAAPEGRVPLGPGDGRDRQAHPAAHHLRRRVRPLHWPLPRQRRGVHGAGADVIGRCASCLHRRSEHDYPNPGDACRRCECPMWFAPWWRWAYQALDQWLAEKIWRDREPGRRLPQAGGGARGDRAVAETGPAAAVRGAPRPQGGAGGGPDAAAAAPREPVAGARPGTAPPHPTWEARVKRLLDWVFLVRRTLSDLQATITRVEWSQAEVLTRLRGMQPMTVVVAKPGDRDAALAELWQLRDQFAT